MLQAEKSNKARETKISKSWNERESQWTISARGFSAITKPSSGTRLACTKARRLFPPELRQRSTSGMEGAQRRPARSDQRDRRLAHRRARQTSHRPYPKRCIKDPISPEFMASPAQRPEIWSECSCRLTFWKTRCRHRLDRWHRAVRRQHS